MHLGKSGAAVQQAQTARDCGRNAVRNLRGQIFQRAVNDAPEPARGELCIRRRFIDRDNAPDFKRLDIFRGFQIKLAFSAAVQQLKLRLGDLESAAFPSFFSLALERDELAGFEAITQIFTVEPYAFQGGASLASNQLKNRHAVARAKHGGVADFSDHGGHLAGAQLTNAARVQPIFVPEGQVIEQVFNGGNILLRQPFGNARANALNEFYFCVEVQH
jgi:hypothetical protein